MTTRKIFLLSLFCSCNLASSLLWPKAHSATPRTYNFNKNRPWATPRSRESSCIIENGGSNRVNFLSVTGGAVSQPDSTQPAGSPAITLSGLASILSWCTIAYVALSSHPTASVDAVCGFRHNALTIAHALVFPLPVLGAVFVALRQLAFASEGFDKQTACRLYLGIVAASLWTAMSVFWGRAFAVGYDLFSDSIRYGCATIHITTAFVALSKWKETVTNLPCDGNSRNASLPRIIRGCVGSLFALLAPRSVGSGAIDDPSGKNNAALYSLGSLGLLILSIMPQLVGFPTATIPAILGKRLSRPASGFTFLGAVVAYCLKDATERGALSNPRNSSNSNRALSTLRRGLGIGALGHLGLVVAKVIGIDGGGLVLPGRGLWDFYPSLVGASGAATFLMVVTYSVLVFATCSSCSSVPAKV